MKKVSGLKKILGAGIIGLASLLPMKYTNAQEIVVNPFVATNQNDSVYNTLETKAQRDSLVQAERDADWCDVAHIPPRPAPQYSGDEIYDCTQYTSQVMTNNNDLGEDINLYDGYKGDPVQDSIYAHKGTLRDMGKRGLPYFHVRINWEGEDHEQLAILTGDDITKWEDWNFVEPQYDAINVHPGEYFMPENCDVVIKYFYVKENEVQGKYISSFPIMKFNIEDRVSSVNWDEELEAVYDQVHNPNVKIYTDRLTATDHVFEELNIYDPKPDTTFKENNAFLNYSFSDKNLDLDSCYYKFNGTKNYFSDTSGSIPLDMKEGLNNLKVFVLDKAGNSESDKRKFYYNPNSTSVSDKNLENILRFYPNPVSTTATLEHEVGEDIVVNIYNAIGQKIYSKKDNDKDGKVNFDFSDYVPGAYFYQTSTGKSGEILKK